MEMARPRAKGPMLATKAFGSSPLAVICQAARKIAEGVAMKSGLMPRAAYSQSAKKTATATARTTLGWDFNQVIVLPAAGCGCRGGNGRTPDARARRRR